MLLEGLLMRTKCFTHADVVEIFYIIRDLWLMYWDINIDFLIEGGDSLEADWPIGYKIGRRKTGHRPG